MGQLHNNNLVYLPEARDIAINILKNGGKIHLHVISESMQPCLLPGDIIQISSVNPINLHLGDMIVFQRGSELITHRLLKWDLSGYFTKGDSSLGLDDRVLGDSIIGVVEEINRNGHIIILKGNYYKIIARALGWLEFRKSQAYLQYKEALEFPVSGKRIINLVRQSKLLFYRLVIIVNRFSIKFIHLYV